MSSHALRETSSSNSSSGAPHVCPAISYDEAAATPFVGSLTFYQFNVILSCLCAAITTSIALFLILKHCWNYTVPSQQSKILKICLLIPIYSILSFIMVASPASSVYLTPWLEVWQSVCIGSFFLLLCEFISPSADGRADFFARVVIDGRAGRVGGQAWFRARWLSVFQYPVVALLVAVVTDLTQAAGVYCASETKTYWARLWLTIASKVSLSAAVFSAVQFYSKLQANFANRRALAKLLAFKLIVAASFIVAIVWSILAGEGSLKPTATLTSADIAFGIRNLIQAVIMVPIAILYLYAYTWKPYEAGSTQRQGPEGAQPLPRLGMGRAVGDMLNPGEILHAILFGFKMPSGGGGQQQQQQAWRPGGGAAGIGRKRRRNGGGSGIPEYSEYHELPQEHMQYGGGGGGWQEEGIAIAATRR